MKKNKVNIFANLCHRVATSAHDIVWFGQLMRYMNKKVVKVIEL